MYLHSMTLQAIGPFAGQHTIDFARLSASGLFLLEGPTGAGKSTVIDAVTFALYGKVASEAASEDRLRSAFASPTVESFVELVFETPSGVYRVRRTPEFQRPKKRGEGTTTQQASVSLWRLVGTPEGGELDIAESMRSVGIDHIDQIAAVGELLSTRLDEAGSEIRRIVGLDRVQFVQTVVLPQGEFARFLRANPEDRGKLLHKVFGTEVFDAIAARLADRRKAAAHHVEAARVALVGAVEHFVGSSGIDDEQAVALRAAVEALAHDPDGLQQRVRTIVTDMAASVVSFAEQEATAHDLLGGARGRVEEAERALAAARRRTELSDRATSLAADEPRIELLRERLAAHDRAATVAALGDGAHAAAAAADAAAEMCATVRAGLPEHVAEAEPAAWSQWQSDIASASVRLARLRVIGAGITGREQQVTDGRKDLDRDVEERGRMVADLADRPAARSAMEAALRQLAVTASGASGAAEKLVRARAVDAAARSVVTLEVESAAALAALTDAAECAEAAVAAEAQLRTARIAGMAGVLAESLVAGRPCPVCGGTEHPVPARYGVGHVSAVDVADAERRRREAETALREAGVRAATVRERFDAERKVAGGLTADAAASAVIAAEELSARMERASAERDDVAHRLDEFDAETSALRDEMGLLSETIASRTVELADMERALTADREEIDAELAAAGPLLGGQLEPRAGDDPVAVLADALKDRAGQLTELVAAENAAQAARESAASRAVELAGAAARQGFESVDEALAAVLEPSDRVELEEDVAVFTAGWATVRAGLADLAGLPGLSIDVAEEAAALARDAANTADVVVRDATRRHGVIARTMESTSEAAHGIDSAVAGWEAARSVAAPVLRMASLASGTGSDNPGGLSLPTFVLVQRFQDVVAAANGRLAEMSSGRYELAHTESREAVRSRRTGLAMTVIDHVTGRPRDPRTLSGGETFYVSLCLALGLADVVTAESGGVELGTLFVDEGFGSLDPGTLDAVLLELGRLRAGGRVVGVVSHVDALKQSIAERIEVRPVHGGGSTLTVRA